MTVVSKSIHGSQNITAGCIISWEQTPYGIKGKTSESNFEISVYSPEIIRVQLSREEIFKPNPYSVVSLPQEGLVEIIDQEQKILILTGKIQVKIDRDNFAITYLDKKGHVLNQDDPAFGVSWLGTEVTNYKKLQSDEKFIGLGEKTGPINKAGKAYTNWNTDNFAYGNDSDPLYMSIPFYMGMHHNGAYGIFLNNTHKSVFNFGASNNRFAYFSAEDGDMDYFFIHDKEISGIISAYTQLTGLPPMPPKWALGYQQCRYSYYPESEVQTLAQTFRDKDFPGDVIYLDIHHMEKYKVFTFDQEKFPNPKAMIKALKAKGFRVVVIMDPGIKVEEPYGPYREGKSKDLFLKYPDGEIYEGQVWPGWCAFPDFTSEEVRKWWAEKMSYYLELGVEGFWTDMNEPASWGQFTPNLINFNYEGEQVSHRKARNIYGMQMARAAHQGAVQNHQRPFVLTRAGFSGVQRYAAAWTGDNVSSEDHMLLGVRLVNSLGLSGVSFAGYDVGGFCGEASPQLYARWMSIAAFSPLFRAHSMINSKDAEPWAFGEEVEEISRNYVKLRYQMLPMIYAAFYRSSKNGLPVAKSLTIDYSRDTKIYEGPYQNQYLFCDQLLIAPVESNKEITKVYLPEGTWYYLFNDKQYPGKQEIYLDTPINYLPVFVKEGSIIPMQSPIAHTGEQHDGNLRLHLYKGEGKSQYIHYEDDGQSHDYQSGHWYQRAIILDSDRQELTLDKVKGTFPSTFEKIELIFHGFDIRKVKLEEEELALSNKVEAFLPKITDFDPLPDNRLPYLETPVLPRVIINNSPKRMVIKFK
ncbi:glycoside hydrolase family 31 protein [Echinicola jeungdonensis]|uniref:Glycoside hydrolase family 31 protein n=1 Tax=Echinicola jeungdonensis TaxID=709343 RepID=A0ABV5J4S2_9BACT|nr:TIM-barrel domain-containing protein [Echinicola jeungdonensis]MDN3667908.1 glycoside hydrolase family 31 protein [Echinicola jeungdonensis]